MRTKVCAIALMAALLPICGTAQAEECGLKLLSKIKLIPSEDGRAEFVPVTIAGGEKKLLLDTGAFGSELFRKTTDDLKLTRRRGDVEVYSVTGDSSDMAVDAPLTIGRIAFTKAIFAVAPPSHEDPNFDGILGLNALSKFDFDIDFGTHELGILSQDHCEGKVIYWPATIIAMVPFEQLYSGHIVIPVELDGKPMKAFLDTGAWGSTLNLRVAQQRLDLDIKPEDATGFLMDRKDLLTYTRKFKTLTFEGVTVNSPEITLIPDVVSAKIDRGPPINSHISRPDPQSEPEMLLGMNVLRHFHIFFSFKEKMVYITPAGTLAPAPAPVK